MRHLTDPCYTRLRLNTNERTSRAGYKHASNHQSSHIRRRSIAIIGIAASLFLILGVIVFNAHAGTMPGIKHSAPTFVAPAINPTRIHNECHTPVHKVGDNILSIHSSGLNRTFIVHLAPSYGNQQQALVVNYHGYQNTALRIAQRTHMGVEADRVGFILVFPQGVDNPPSWNAGIGAYGPTGDADDVQFTRDLISYFEHNYCVDAHHIYVTGYSLGGGMAYRIALVSSAIKLRHSQLYQAHFTAFRSVAIHHGLFQCWKFMGRLIILLRTMGIAIWVWQQYKHI